MSEMSLKELTGKTAEEFIQEKTAEIMAAVGGGKAVCALSGGVDSSTVALLAHKATGTNLDAVFIDDGLMRENEPKGVQEIFGGLGVQVRVLDFKKDFFDALKGLTDPEEKRKAFRDTFYKTFGRVVKESGAKFILQGTIKADIEETQKGVKTQHNILEQIGISPEQYGFRVIEPVKDLYKPQVREVAKALGLPEEVWKRMPFPGPGLCTRVLGEVTPERVETVRKAHVVVEEEFKEFAPFQCFAVLLSDKATGLDEEGRREFGDIIVVRSVDSADALTASPTKVAFEKLEHVRDKILKIPGVVKVLYDLTPKPPSTIEYI